MQHRFTVTTDDKATHEIYLEDGVIYKQSTYPDSEPRNEVKVGDQHLPKGRRFQGGIDVSYFVQGDMLYLRYEEIYHKNCHAIWLNDNCGVLIEPLMYNTLAAEHNKKVKTMEEYDTTIANLRNWKTHLTAENDRISKERDDKIEEVRKPLNETILMLQKQLAEQRQVVKEKQEYIDALPRNELKNVRSSINKDFEIQCKDCVSIPVHSGVLAAFWPWFKTMLDNECVVTEKKSLQLDYDSEVVEILIKDLYGQDIELDFETCLPLLEITGMYQLPELAATVYEHILLSEQDLDLEDCVNGWKSARLGDHEQAKTFFAKLVYSKTKEKLTEEGHKEEFDVLTKEETLELLFGALM